MSNKAQIIKKKTKKNASLDVKRFYVPGYVLEDVCPECGKKYKRDFEEHYINYPTIGKQNITCWCDKCDHEWEVKVELIVELKIV